jgi:hypothetical protein
MFGSNYHEVDNSKDLSAASKEERQNFSKGLDTLHKHFRKVVGTKPTHPEAKKWMDENRSKLKEDFIPTDFDVDEWEKACLKDEYYDLDEK